MLWGGTQNPPEFIYKNCVFILTCLNFSHLQSTLHLMQYTCNMEMFFPLLKTVSGLIDSDAFLVTPTFCFTFSTTARLFHPGKQTKEVTWGEIGWTGRVGHGGHAAFWSKTAEHSAWCGQVHSYITHHEMGKCVESSKKIHWSQTQPLITTSQLVHCYIWIPLEHSSSRGKPVLQRGLHSRR